MQRRAAWRDWCEVVPGHALEPRVGGHQKGSIGCSIEGPHVTLPHGAMLTGRVRAGATEFDETISGSRPRSPIAPQGKRTHDTEIDQRLHPVRCKAVQAID